MRSMRAPLRPLEVNSAIAAFRITARVRSGSLGPERRRRGWALLTRASIDGSPACASDRGPLLRFHLFPKNIVTADDDKVLGGIFEEMQGGGVGVLGFARRYRLHEVAM